jgi:hypothetical protein
MDDETQVRVARNEALFRDTNEAIERGQWRDSPAKLVRFRCECARLDCNEAVLLTVAEYEQVRSSPRRFALLPGHELTEVERVVEEFDRFVVVEKQDVAGQVAAATDPRG